MRSIWAVGLLGLFASACQDYYFNKIEPETIKEATVVVPAAKPVPADILFVVDNSCSMEDEQQNLGVNFNAFINEIAGSGDYRIAIVSTDVTSLPAVERAGLRQSSFKSAVPYTLVDIADEACIKTTIEHGCFRGPGAPETRIITSTLTAAEQVRLFNDNVALGSCGDGAFEAGLAAMKLALDNTRRGRCNEGFLRPDANLVVVIVSDENDTDPGGNPAGSMPVAVRNYVEELKRAKNGNAGAIRVAVIVGSKDGAAENCRPGGGSCGGQCTMRPPEGSRAMGCRQNPNVCMSGEYCDDMNRCQNRDLQFWDQFCHWCSYYKAPECCSALAGDRYVEFALAMEHDVAAANPSISVTGCKSDGEKRIACLIDSVCQDNFGETLKKIARDLVNTSEYVLDPAACNPAGVEVRIAGKELVYGKDFQVLEEGKLLKLTEAKPGPNDQVQISFVTDGCK